MTACARIGRIGRVVVAQGCGRAGERDLPVPLRNPAITPNEDLPGGVAPLQCKSLQGQEEQQGIVLVEKRTSLQQLASVEVVITPEIDATELSKFRSRIVGDLYKSSYHRVFAFARRLVSDDDAEEVAHESFVRLLRVRNLERMQISVAYLLRIAENLIRRRHGQAQRFREVLQNSGRMVPECERHGWHPLMRSADDARVASERRGPTPAEAERLDELLRLLTPAEHSAVRLIVCEGLDYQAAARSLGVPVSTINNWKHRALAKLKQSLSESQFGGTPGRGRPPACRVG
jgi:RNA polymerase sigma factor (sigma-70 family)